MKPTRAFLAAEWRNLVMLNYVVDPALLLPFVPRGTDLDSWEGRTYISVVGFLFANTRVLGVPIPLHTTFEEVNLRFYVRRVMNGEVRRAVTFLREFVPRTAIAITARLAYNEPYAALPMRHVYGPALHGAPNLLEYEWRLRGEWCGFAVRPNESSRPLEAGSEEQFITEHYWGYTRQRDGSTVEYHVVHPNWRICGVGTPEIHGAFASSFGPAFAPVLARRPDSAFLAIGSAVTVSVPRRLDLA